MSAEDPNDHLERYLNAYLGDVDAPPFAVLVKGGWGIGKTHYVKEVLARSQYIDDQRRAILVSLNGLRTPDEIDRALAAAIVLLIDTKLSKVVGRVATVAAKYFNVDLDLKLSDVVAILDGHVYVFDDLERFAGEKQVALRYINEFVERHGRKIILISNVDEIDDAEFNRAKEKTIGIELEFQPLSRAAISALVGEYLNLPDDTDATSIAALIVDIFVTGEVANLRALRHTIWDFARLVAALDEVHSTHTEFMRALASAYFPVAFDYRLKRLSDDDIRDIGGLEYLGIADSGADSPWLALRARYASFEPNVRILPAWLWDKLLVSGCVPQKELLAAVNNTRYFGNVRPSWWRLWSHQDETPADLEVLFADMRR
jgi:hypothetical protein